jgi:TonB family protein
MRTCTKCQRTYTDDMDYCPRDATALASVASATQMELQAALGHRFRIVRRLGGGGMGTVFLAEQIAVGNRPVALKVLLRKLLDDPEFLMRFRNEAVSTGCIDHPNVVTIYESGQADDGTPYIAMQYLEGESLRSKLKAGGALPVVECAMVVTQVARGLSAAHKLGIIHRDLKPDNIFLTRGDEGELVVKVVDFGIAKLRESTTHTLTGTVLGTPAYMSFEQASGMRSEELDARSDIYSFGVVAYEMLTGRVPFHSDTPLGYVRKHLSEEPPPFRAVKPELAAAAQLEQVVMKALAKNREARYGSVLEFGRAFAEAARPRQPAVSEAPLPPTQIVRPPVVAAGSALPLDVGAKTENRRPQASPTKPVSPPARRAAKFRAPLWLSLALFALLLGLGGWYLSSAMHQGSGSQAGPATESPTPSTNPPTVKEAAPTRTESPAPPANSRVVKKAPSAPTGSPKVAQHQGPLSVPEQLKFELPQSKCSDSLGNPSWNCPGPGGNVGGGVGTGNGPAKGGGRGPDEGGVYNYKVGGGVSLPIAIYKPEPPYSAEAREAKFQGTVTLVVVVDASGTVTDCKVTKPLGKGLDEKAVETVRTWKFRPAMRNGAPVAVRVSVEVSFRLF